MKRLVNSKLPGDFFVSDGGEVYYYEDGLNVDGNDEANKSPEYTEYVLTDDDFEWVNSTSTGTYYNLDGEQGFFNYVGEGQEIIEIPHVIQGIEMTSYYRMFHETGEDVKKVISTNECKLFLIVTNLDSIYTFHRYDIVSLYLYYNRRYLFTWQERH